MADMELWRSILYLTWFIVLAALSWNILKSRQENSSESTVSRRLIPRRVNTQNKRRLLRLIANFFGLLLVLWGVQYAIDSFASDSTLILLVGIALAIAGGFFVSIANKST
jgi:uncharacterized membrane protein YcjF (UPF0283 family)